MNKTHQLRPLGESITWKGGNNDIKCRLSLSALRQESKQLFRFDEGSWPCEGGCQHVMMWLPLLPSFFITPFVSTPTPQFLATSGVEQREREESEGGRKGLRTSMNKQQRNRSLNLALRMHEMENQLAILLLRFNLRDELRKGVQVRLGFAPVESVLPILGE